MTRKARSSASTWRGSTTAIPRISRSIRRRQAVTGGTLRRFRPAARDVWLGRGGHASQRLPRAFHGQVRRGGSEPGPHQGTPASLLKDGHGRDAVVTERIHDGNNIESRETRTTYLPTGEPETISRVRVGKADAPVVRWMRYDTQGRRVFNVEPNTSVGFNPDPTTSADAIQAWRYAYNDAGDLVGTSDARGCGANYLYDAAGRLVVEDYAPCTASQQAYSAPNLGNGTGIEVLYHYDAADPDEPANFCGTDLFLGRLASVSDRASKTLSCYDGRGRVTGTAKRIAKPGTPDDVLANRYAPRWYVRHAQFDAAESPDPRIHGRPGVGPARRG